MVFVTSLFVLITTGAGDTVPQTTGGTRFVVDFKVNPTPLVDQANITLTPDRISVSCGATRPAKKLLAVSVFVGTLMP